jgi:SPX domain protein involved in polyphosphate accumulation
MEKDLNVSQNGRYKIKSLYFDNAYDDALKEKYDGISDREKFRIRLYNDDDSFIRLEKKLKHNGLNEKTSARLTREQVEALLKGDYDWLKSFDKEIYAEFYYNLRVKGLRPKTIVQYIREPYVYRYGNVRVTIDSDVRTGLNSVDLFDKELLTVPVLESGKSILEIKYDEYLPDIIKTLTQIGARERTQASKYAACRIYL